MPKHQIFQNLVNTLYFFLYIQNITRIIEHP